MSTVFRVILIVVSLLTTFYILKKIRQSKLQIEYAIFCIFVLLVKMFLMTIELSTLENKVKDLTQELALEEKERADEQKEENKGKNR